MELTCLWRALALGACCAQPLGVTAQPAHIYRIAEVGDVSPTDISSDGGVVVGRYYHSGENRWFRWTLAGGMELVGAADDSLEDTAFGVSGDGSTLVGQSRNRAYRWTRSGGAQSLGQLDDQRLWSEAFSASFDGSVIVGTAGESTSQMGFRWTEATGMVGLGGLHDPQGRSYASDISADGSVIVGRVADPVDILFPSIWTEAEGWSVLANTPSWNTFGNAEAASSDGSFVVGAVSDGGVRQAFRWERATGGFMLLDKHINHARDFFAEDVSDDGRFVVGKVGYNDGLSRAIIWDAEHGTRLLQKILADEYGLDMRGWTLLDAAAISRDGLTITGSGRYYGGAGSFVVTLPAPATLSGLVFGAVLACRRRR